METNNNVEGEMKQQQPRGAFTQATRSFKRKDYSRYVSGLTAAGILILAGCASQPATESSDQGAAPPPTASPTVKSTQAAPAPQADIEAKAAPAPTPEGGANAVAKTESGNAAAAATEPAAPVAVPPPVEPLPTLAAGAELSDRQNIPDPAETVSEPAAETNTVANTPAPETPAAAPAPAEPELSAAEQAAAAVASLAAPQKQYAVRGEAFDVSRKDLPVTSGLWILKRGEALMDKDIVIGTPTWEMGKVGYNSQIWVTVMDDKLLINSSSDIDVKAGKTGIRIDNGELIPFSRIEGNNIGVLDGDWLDALAAGNQMEISMGFFPGREPRSDTFTSDVSLKGMARIVATYRKLTQ